MDLYYPQMDDYVWSSCTQDPVFDHGTSVHQGSTTFHHGGGGGNGGGHGGGESEDGKGGSASKNHSEAEKRRRDRINAHLATLRKLVSHSDKMDKATLLGKVVDHIKELKSETLEISKVFTIPTDIDEVIIDLDSNTMNSSNNVFIRASVCCEDRPELFSEITQALNSLRITLIQADMTCLGGRIKCKLILCVTNNTNENEMTTLRKSLKVLFDRIVSTSSWNASSNFRIKSKRQRFFCSANYHSNDY